MPKEKINVPFKESNSHYCSTVVSVNGFLYTGGSAVLDLLRECKGITTLSATINPQTQHASDLGAGEVTFFRKLNFLGLKRVFFNGDDTDFNAIMIDFIRRYYELYRQSQNSDWECSIQSTKLFKKYIDGFLLSILDLTDDDVDFIDNNPDFFFQYNTHRILGATDNQLTDNQVRELLSKQVLSFNKGYYIFYKRKNISEREFDEQVKLLVSKFFKSIVSSDVLVLDNFIQSCPFEHHKKMLPLDEFKFRSINVIRDIRDAYFTVQSFATAPVNISISAYIQRYKLINIPKNYNSDNSNVLLIWLEDLIYNYDVTVQQIFDFIGIKKTAHTEPKYFFNPSISAKNVGSYKKYHDQSIINRLIIECPELCYETRNTRASNINYDSCIVEPFDMLIN